MVNFHSIKMNEQKKKKKLNESKQNDDDGPSATSYMLTKPFTC